MSLTSRVLRNAAFQMMSQAVTWLFAWVLLIALPRYLGDEGFGQLFFALSFALIASMFLNLGINTYLQKQVARDPEEGHKLLAHAMSLKLGLSVLLYPVMMIVSRTMDIDGEALLAVDIIGLSFVIGSFGLTFSTYLQGEQLGWAPAAGLIMEKFVITAGSVLLLWQGFGLVAVAWVHLAGALISTAYTGLVLYRRVPFALGFDREVYSRIVRGSLPFLIWIVFGEIYVRIDVLMLSSLTSDQVVGWYGAAFRLYGTLLFIPNIFMTTVFPAITRKFAEDAREAGFATRRSLNLMMLVAVPIGFGMMLVAGPTVELLFGLENFYHTIGNLQIFGIAMIVVCVDVVLGSALIANDRQKAWAKAAVGAAVLNPALNLVLIPLFDRTMGNGGFGAALATLATETFMLVIALRLLPKGIFDESNSLCAMRAVFAGVVMLAAAQPIMHLGLIPVIALGGVVYVAAVLAFRALPRDDVLHIFDAVRKAAKRGT